MSGTAKQELSNYNIVAKREDLNNKQNKTQYELAMIQIYDYIIYCVSRDPIRGDMCTEENVQRIKLAGRILNECGRVVIMLSTLQNFVPGRYVGEISSMWDGIGQWRG
jgi:hypothetical protein